jgi:hypothetical protein
MCPVFRGQKNVEPEMALLPCSKVSSWYTQEKQDLFFENFFE